MSVRDEIVLGEGVAIDAAAASVALRAGSGAIDSVVYVGCYAALLDLVGPLARSLNGGMAAALNVTLVVAWFVVLPASIEILTRGLSLGRLAVGVRIVRDDGGPVSARYAFGRALVGFVEIYATAGLGAITTSFLSARGKRLGDILVGTYAMRTRGGRRSLPPVAMPFGLAQWASAADVRRTPDGLALTARLFLASAHEMTPEARRRLGTQLAQRLMPLVAPPPPPGTHPETFIAAVLATRRDREYAALWRADQINAADAQRLTRLPYGIADTDN